MFNNYLKVAFRNLMRHKLYSSIKIGGLGIGIAACILICLFIRDEWSFDTEYADSDRIYRMVNVWAPPAGTQRWVAQQPPMLGVIRDEMPEVEVACRVVPYGRLLAGSNLFRRSDHVQNNFEEGFIYADASILDVFDFNLISGDRESALTAPKTLLISRSKAEKYFPNEEPVGQTVIFNDDSAPYRIDGVIEDLSENTHFDFDFIINVIGEEAWPNEHNSWCCTNYDIYLKIREDADAESVVTRLYDVRDTHMANYLKRQGRADLDDLQYRGFELQNIEQIHLYSADISDDYTHGDIKVVWMFGGVALLILLLACINFVNLSTAKSANRAKEVGLRKVVGSRKTDLIGQFLSESVLFSSLSLGLGLVLATLSLSYFNLVADKKLSIPFFEWWFLPAAFAITTAVGFLAGIYPSFYLSAFKPVEVLKGKLSLGSKSSHLQNGMVIFQFIASVVLIISAMVVNRQMGYILNKKLGFDKEQIVMLQGTNTLESKLPAFKNELNQLSEVQNVTVTAFLPLEGMAQDGNQFWLEGRKLEDAPIGGQLWRVDHDYLNTLGMELTAGRNFDPNLVSDSSSILVNETFVRDFGFENPIGKRITNGYEAPRTIIGVIKNFHFRSVKGEITALSMVLGSQPEVTAVKVKTSDLMGTMDRIARVWDQFVPNQPIRYEFMDDRFEAMYSDIRRTGQVFTSFSVLAIIIACLGLFALSAFMIEQRRKEISVRKVLGASYSGLFASLTSNFFKLVAVSLVIAIPLGWYTMNQWLAGYRYATDLSWDVFVLAGSMIVLITGGTISYEIVRAVRVNPAETLHSE